MTSARVVGAREALEVARRRSVEVDLSWLRPESERDAWTMGDDALRFLGRLIAELQPQRIVELGSGVSTRVMAAACRGMEQPGTLVSLESDPFFERRTRAALASDASGHVARVALTHLVVRRWYDRNVPVYDLPATVLQGPAPQLVLVDGPPLPLGGREGSLLQAVHLADGGTIVLLDDADRPSERAALALAEDVFGDAIEVVGLSGFTKGLAAIVVHRDVGGSAMPPAPPELPL